MKWWKFTQSNSTQNQFKFVLFGKLEQLVRWTIEWYNTNIWMSTCKREIFCGVESMRENGTFAQYVINKCYYFAIFFFFFVSGVEFVVGWINWYAIVPLYLFLNRFFVFTFSLKRIQKFEYLCCFPLFVFKCKIFESSVLFFVSIWALALTYVYA